MGRTRYRSKACLFAEKINKHERKFKAELVVIKEGCEELGTRFSDPKTVSRACR